MEQDFQDRRYDIVIANNVLHTTPNLGGSLRKINKLLAPSGRLFLQELTPGSNWINTILGTTPTWWLETTAGRVDEPYIDTNGWQDELQSSGFGPPDTIIFDSTDPSTRINYIILARPSTHPNKTTPPEPKNISLLVKDKTKTYKIAEQTLQEQGYKVTKITLKDTPHPPNVEIISLLDLDADADGPFLENISDESFHDLQTFLSNLDKSAIFWVTRPCHVRVLDPRYAQVIGLARVIRSELLIDFATCEVDDADDAASFALVTQVFERFRARNTIDNDEENPLSPDFEYVIDKGVIHIGRYFPFVMMDEFNQDLKDNSRLKLAMETPGRLNTLHWARQPEPTTSLADHEVEVEVHAVGISSDDINGLSDCAGVIRAVGAKVNTDNLKPGDRVALIEKNVFSTLLITNENRCVKIPDSLSFSEASTMFLPFATAQQSLLTVGRLRKGDSVLIHSACGGVGLAAVQIAQMIGADIYATVETEEQEWYLVENYDIPSNKIFTCDSSDNSFVRGVLRETKGRGVDMVLNSLSGELLTETWKCVAPYGKLVDVGGRDSDLVARGSGGLNISMGSFAANRSYCCVDVGSFGDDVDSLHHFRGWMTETLEYLEKDLIKPLPLAKEFDASSVAEAFKYLLPGSTHIGRVGVRLLQEDNDGINQLTLSKNEVITNPRKELNLDPQASYLLVGGLGGLGRAVSTYMVEHGARNLTFLGRSAGKSDSDQSFIRELESMGVTVTTVRGDITSLEDVTHAISQSQSKYPLKGILQLSTVQADENFLRMNKKSHWDYSIAPKVTGTWNLHHATTTNTIGSISLDFFVLFSSLSSTIGLPGQANYASGNSFLDSFVQYRNHLGLACSAVDIGPVADIGMLADQDALLQTAKLAGFKTLMEQQVLDAIGLSMMASIPPLNTSQERVFSDPNVFVLGLGSTIPLNDPSNRAVWRKDRRMAIYHNNNTTTLDSNTHSTKGKQESRLKTYLKQATSDPSILKTAKAGIFLGQEIGRQLFTLLLREVDENDEGDGDSGNGIDTSVALTDLGLDSLVAIELRKWWRPTFGFDISVLEMMRMGSLEALGRFVVKKLLETSEGSE